MHLFLFRFAYSGFISMNLNFLLELLNGTFARTHNAYISSTHDTVFISETKETHSPNCTHLVPSRVMVEHHAWSPHNQRCYDVTYDMIYDVTYDMIYDVTCDMGYDKQAHSQHEKCTNSPN